MSKSYVLFWELVSYNLLGINGIWPLLEIFGIKFFTIAFALCIFTLKKCIHSSIYVLFCIKLFQENSYYPVRGHQIFNDKIARKLPLVILIGWSLDIARYLEFTRPEKDPRILVWHGKWEDPENGRAWKWTTRDAREDCTNDENGDQLDKRERDYWWSQFAKRAYVLERWHRSIHCAKFERPLSIRKTKERTFWTVKTRRHAAKVQSSRQEAERDWRCERSQECGP